MDSDIHTQVQLKNASIKELKVPVHHQLICRYGLSIHSQS
jgi:hypothetical protein